MKKNEKHEPYCGCQNCKPVNTTDIPETGEWPVVKAGATEAAPSPERGDKRPPTGVAEEAGAV
jgi:hypothetical protein